MIKSSYDPTKKTQQLGSIDIHCRDHTNDYTLRYQPKHPNKQIAKMYPYGPGKSFHTLQINEERKREREQEREQREQERRKQAEAAKQAAKKVDQGKMQQQQQQQQQQQRQQRQQK
ncbi:hypothetical protein GGS21DRAFT_491538 [Xylaria nigripes]|nr:hypothetical protein GGS21DRAFT_491538 [Xylaria nigripes]